MFQNQPDHQFTGGANLLLAVIVLAIMILPTVINISEFALRSIPGAAGICCALLAGMVLYILYQGFHSISWEFVTTATSATKGTVGILGNILNTLYVVVCTLAMSVP